MTKYKRIPKTLWQRVWFKIRPHPLVHIDYDCSAGLNPGYLWIIQHTTHDSRISWQAKIEWFEANYEPVCICTKKAKDIDCKECFTDEFRKDFKAGRERERQQYQKILDGFKNTNIFIKSDCGWENNPQSMLYKHKLPTEGDKTSESGL